MSDTEHTHVFSDDSAPETHYVESPTVDEQPQDDDAELASSEQLK